jgi:hypothetical protein
MRVYACACVCFAYVRVRVCIHPLNVDISTFAANEKKKCVCGGGGGIESLNNVASLCAHTDMLTSKET